MTTKTHITTIEERHKNDKDKHNDDKETHNNHQKTQNDYKWEASNNEETRAVSADK